MFVLFLWKIKLTKNLLFLFVIITLFFYMVLNLFYVLEYLPSSIWNGLLRFTIKWRMFNLYFIIITLFSRFRSALWCHLKSIYIILLIQPKITWFWRIICLDNLRNSSIFHLLLLTWDNLFHMALTLRNYDIQI